MTSHDPSQYVWWLTSRAAGITAFALASISVLIGLTMAGRLARRPGMARTLRVIHEQAALGALGAMVVHGAALLGDGWLKPGIAGVLVPFHMGYRPVFTALGIVSAYGAGLLGLSFYARRRIGPRRWRAAHRATIVVWLAAAIHALGAGTDASTGWMRAILVSSAVPIGLLFAIRVLGARRRAAPQRQRAPARRQRPEVATARAGANR